MTGAIGVTGAGGFLGSRLCRMLVEQGMRVRAVHRRDSTPPALAELAARPGAAVELVSADLESADGPRRAVEGCSALIHAAARVSDWGTREQYLRANFEATVALLHAAEKAGCARFVAVGTVGVHGMGSHRGTTEEGPYYGDLPDYQDTKLMAERAVLARNGPGFATSVLRMGYLYGPGDTTSTYRIFRAIEAGVFGYIGDGSARTSMIYVDDACRALIAALSSTETAGQAINITDGSAVSWKELTEEMYAVLGSRARPLRIPRALAAAGASILTAGARLVRSSRGPVLTAYRVRRQTTDFVFSNEKARRLLGFAPSVTYAEGMKLAAAAYRSSKKA
jgi:nucleoside-diphosphate-sugar epimerase